MNRRIRKSYEEAKIRDIFRPGKTQAGMRDTEAEIRDVPGNTGRLASLRDRQTDRRTGCNTLSHRCKCKTSDLLVNSVILCM